MSETTEDRVKQESEGETIEAGYIGELEDLPFHEARHRAETAKRLAFLLVWILAISVGLHYIATATLAVWGKADTAESLASIFNIWLPVISSLVSAAGTYYFTKEKS